MNLQNILWRTSIPKICYCTRAVSNFLEEGFINCIWTCFTHTCIHHKTPEMLTLLGLMMSGTVCDFKFGRMRQIQIPDKGELPKSNSMQRLVQLRVAGRKWCPAARNVRAPLRDGRSEDGGAVRRDRTRSLTARMGTGIGEAGTSPLLLH